VKLVERPTFGNGEQYSTIAGMKELDCRDDGRLFLRNEYDKIFRAVGWRSLEDVFAKLPKHKLLRSRNYPGGWDNLRLTFPSDPFLEAKPIVAFMKRHRPIDDVTAPAGLIEAAAVGLCQRANVPCMRVLAAGAAPAKSDGTGVPYESVFISEAIGDGDDAFHRACRLLGDCSSHECDAELRLILKAVVETVARMHAAELFHGDCHLNHFMLDQSDADGAMIARVIDLQGVRQATGARATYLWLKDMGQLRASLLKLGLYRRYRQWWYQTYAETRKRLDGAQFGGRWARYLVGTRGNMRILKGMLSNATRFRFHQVRQQTGLIFPRNGFGWQAGVWHDPK